MNNTAKDNYVYILDGRAYVNLTNKCHNACKFCIRNTGSGVAGTPLWLKSEPTAKQVIDAFTELKDSVTDSEVVFCGYGEPTERVKVLSECAAEFKRLGYKTRLNTNGLGSLVNGWDITAELKDVDTVSISLNAEDSEKYAEITQSVYGTDAFGAVIDFAAACKRAGLNTVFTVVDVEGVDVQKCRELCAELGIPLRVREYISDNYGDRRDENA